MPVDMLSHQSVTIKQPSTETYFACRGIDR